MTQQTDPFLGSLSEESELVPVTVLRPGDSPRIAGQDPLHVRALAQLDIELPSIVVHRPTMRVIDGMHRLNAVRLRGGTTIRARFFDGSDHDAFVLAVKLNSAHGLPLSRADRTAAAARILVSHSDWSDRLVAKLSGLSHTTVASIRRRSTGNSQQLNARTGRDGRTRPLSTSEGRQLAGRLMAERPSAPLREIAEAAGIALATARDVRERVRRGEDPVPGKLRDDDVQQADQPRKAPQSAPPEEIATVLEQLRRDPSLRMSERGRTILRLLDIAQMASRTSDWTMLSDSVPPHCATRLARVARASAEAWLHFAQAIEKRENPVPDHRTSA
ncbi:MULTISPECIES: cell cycle transcriptional regulator TrcR [unclassified Nonomuraea]|uniref:ParB/RepB/Spo0J family partition protein n=1 Tax=unclassified Nonomuraea TaxID=2593643 RepID=UPI0033CF6AF0